MALLIELHDPATRRRIAACYHGQHPDYVTHWVDVAYDNRPLSEHGWTKRGRFPICPLHRQPGDVQDGATPAAAPSCARPTPARSAEVLEISEAGATDLFGVQPAGFALGSGRPIECVFQDWDPGDILSVEFFAQVVSRHRAGDTLVQAQLSVDGGANWLGVSGARAHLADESFSVSAASSVTVYLPPRVRLHVTAYSGPDYGPGPEGSSLLLRCRRYRAGTYQPIGQVLPLGGL